MRLHPDSGECWPSASATGTRLAPGGNRDLEVALRGHYRDHFCSVGSGFRGGDAPLRRRACWRGGSQTAELVELALETHGPGPSWTLLRLQAGVPERSDNLLAKSPVDPDVRVVAQSRDEIHGALQGQVLGLERGDDHTECPFHLSRHLGGLEAHCSRFPGCQVVQEHPFCLGVAERYTDDRRDNFDIYLPLWLARYNKEIFGVLFLAGVLYTLARWRGWAG